MRMKELLHQLECDLRAWLSQRENLESDVLPVMHCKRVPTVIAKVKSHMAKKVLEKNWCRLGHLTEFEMGRSLAQNSLP